MRYCLAYVSSSAVPAPISVRSTASFSCIPPLRQHSTPSTRSSFSSSDVVGKVCMPAHTMSEDTKSSSVRGRRVLVLSNPDPGDSSSSDDDRQRRYHQPQTSYSSLPQTSASMPPSSSYRTPRPAHPTPLTTDLPHHITSSHSNPTLSSPSSQSSNAVESTPPPSTPGQTGPPEVGTALFTHDDTSTVNDRAEMHHQSRLQKLSDKLWKSRRPSSHRPKDSEGSLHSPPPSCQSPHGSSQERVIMVTQDCHAYTLVDVTPPKSSAFIWERIFTQLKIADEDQSSGFAIYRTQVGKAAVGEALPNESLLRLVRDQGDSEGGLKFLVCHAQARVQEPSLPTSPVRSMPPPSVFAPLVPRSRPSQSSRQESISSEDPTPDTGYEPSAVSDDFDDGDHRSTMRPHQYMPNVSSTFIPSPQSAYQDTRQPPSPVSARRHQIYDADLRIASSVPASLSTPVLEDMLTPPRRQHLRRISNAEEREQALRDSERIIQQADAEWSRNLSSSFGAANKMKAPHQRSGLGASISDEVGERRRDMRPPGAREQDAAPLAGGRRPSPTVSRSPSSKKKSSRADGGFPARPLQQPPQKSGGRIAPVGYYITWKAPDSTASTSSTKQLKSAKSMEMLKTLASPPPAPLRPSPSRPQLSVPSNAGFSPVRPVEQAPRLHRPLPPTQAPAVENTNSDSGGTPRSFLQPSPAASSNVAAYLSPTQTQDSYSRPHSTSPSHQRYPKPVDIPIHDLSRDRDAQRPGLSLHHQSHSTGSSGSVSKFGDTPFREDGYGGNTLPLSLRPGPYGGSPVRPHVSPETPPRSPVSAASSRPGTSTTTGAFSYSSTGTVVAPRQSSSSSEQDTVSESTLRPEERDKMIWDLKARVATQKPSQMDSDAPVDNIGTVDSYCTATEDLWSKRPISQMVRDAEKDDPIPTPKSSPRPALNVITQSNTPSSNGRWVPSNFPPPPDFIPETQPQPRLRNPISSRNNHKSSTFEELTWAHRPPPEDVYERLEEFFPEHDLDKPVIEANSGGTSPTAAEHAYGIPPNDRERITGVRGKKSIRIVAEEHKKRLDRTSRAEPAYGNLLRRSTKLWGGHVEEVTTSQKKPTINKPLPDNPAGGPRPIFKWVRGELIGKGTYGRVYLALNATTGEMIAVKQVEIPTTASDKSDSRQTNFVQALKMESETLKDLDHPHIVAYLGFEETPSFLSIFLEYVPGGSVGSCLRDHGKFDEEVTKSFTAQILHGLAYLHSKNIIHRDLKADNILVEKTGICKISDFGISKRTDDDQGAFTAMRGTVFWMAPEVIGSQKGKGYNSKVDIWSVGCVVLEMWAGRRPWPDEDFFTVMYKVSHEGKSPPIPPDVILSDLATDFKDRCFAVHPDARATAAELIQHPYLKLPEGWIFNDFK